MVQSLFYLIYTHHPLPYKKGWGGPIANILIFFIF